MEEVKTPPKRKPAYRNLTIPERDELFAFYEKHGGNRLAMTRDPDCSFKSYAQLSHYAKLYGFKTKLVEIRLKKAKDVMGELEDAKVEAIARAREMMKPRQVLIVFRGGARSGEPILDTDGQPQFAEIYPSEKQIKVAWEIIKTELGEATSVSKTDITSKGKQLRDNAITFVEFTGAKKEEKEEVEPPKENATGK